MPAPRTNAHILLDAVQATVEADVSRLQTLSHQHSLNFELVLRILLTFLPESTDPAVYVPLLQDLSSGYADSKHIDEDTQLKKENDIGHQQEEEGLSSDEARRKVRSLRLLPLATTEDALIGGEDGLQPELLSFLLLRSRRIDSETGALPLVQQLLEPFVDHSSHLKLWMATTILPLLRLNYELYADRQEAISLEAFESLRGGAALDSLIGGGISAPDSVEVYIRDLNQIAGPWLMGETCRRARSGRDAAQLDKNKAEQASAVTVWGWVNNWLLHLAERDPATALAIARSDSWKGPESVDDGGYNIQDDGQISAWLWGAASVSSSTAFTRIRRDHCRTALCIFYTTPDASEGTFESLEQLLLQTAEQLGHDGPVAEILSGSPQDSNLAETFFDRAKNSVLNTRSTELLADGNALTELTVDSLCFAAWYLKSSIKLLSLETPAPIIKNIQMATLGTSAEQKTLLQRYLNIVSDREVDERACVQLRDNVSLLRNKPASKDGKSTLPHGMWGQVSEEEVEALFLKALLSSTRYKLAEEMYLSGSGPLSKESVEDAAIAVALSMFDSATSGNRTRGGMKKASDIVAAFRQHFPQSSKFPRLEALIRATHSLSSYSLSLQHGVPCVPVNIRTQIQPLNLVDQVLAQNEDAYTSLDDLTRIATELARSGLLITSSGKLNGINSVYHQQPAAQSYTSPAFLAADISDLADTIDMASQAVASKSIRASLKAGDFDTAYSYITTRLAGRATPNTWEAIDDENSLWRTALAAGRFESRTEARDGPKYLRRLEQKMELLASALEFAPPPALSQVLEAWQECEAQVNAATAKEAEVEMAWDDSGDKRSSMRVADGDRHLPGGFGSEAWIHNAEGTGGRKWGAGQEEAPMGLFDVARGAAAALQKSAFAGQGTGRGGRAPGAATAGGGGAQDNAREQHDGEGRVRKRDVVSNAVTSGLVSGIGWVIGAKPAHDQQ